MSSNEFGQYGESIPEEKFLRDQGESREADEDRYPSYDKESIIDGLKARGVAKVVVGYDGSWDEGFVREIDARSDDGDRLALDAPLRDVIEQYVEEALPDEWEEDDGAFGEVTFDVGGGTVSFTHNRRFTDHTTETWEG